MVKLDVKYSVVLDGENVVLEGIQNLPTEIEKDLVKRGFAKELLKEDVAPKDLEKAKTIFLVDGKLTEKEPVADKTDIQEPVNTNAGDESGDDSGDDSEITFESLMEMEIKDIKALAKEKGLELKATKKEDLAKEFVEILGA